MHPPKHRRRHDYDNYMITPQQSHQALAQALSFPHALYLKREDLHPLGSHKGRSIPHMIKKYTELGHTDFAIASSGNAALAAIQAVQAMNTTTMTLKVFVGQHIAPKKLQLLHDRAGTSSAITIEQVNRPQQTVFQLQKSKQAQPLRQSTDATALVGYTSLAQELLNIPNLAAVFVPTSSGTCAQALGEYFVAHNHAVQIHIAQTTSCHPIAQVFAKDSTLQSQEKKSPAALKHAKTTQSDQPSLANAIVDQVAHRKDAVVATINQTQGSGWIISNEEITNAQQHVQAATALTISPNSSLAVAALKQALAANWQLPGAVACLITGA